MEPKKKEQKRAREDSLAHPFSFGDDIVRSSGQPEALSQAGQDLKVMHSKRIEEYKKTLHLNDFQRELIVGKLLGDGHLETADKGKTYRLKIEHSVKQKDYVDWLYEQFKAWTGQAPKGRSRRVRMPQGTYAMSESYGFTTYAHSAFRFYAQQFYGTSGKKIIPKLIRKLLIPTALAIWYLDDGSFKSEHHRTFIIHAHGYEKKDLQRVQDALEKLSVKSSLHRQNRTTGIYWRIYILSESADCFAQMIREIVNSVPSMSYKLGNKLPKR